MRLCKLTAVALAAHILLLNGCGGSGSNESGAPVGQSAKDFTPTRFVYADQTISGAHQIAAFGFDDAHNVLFALPNFRPAPLPNQPTRLIVAESSLGELVYGFPGNGTIVGFVGNRESATLTTIPGNPFPAPGVINGVFTPGFFLIAAGGGLLHVYTHADATGALTEQTSVPDPNSGAVLTVSPGPDTQSVLLYSGDTSGGPLAAFFFNFVTGAIIQVSGSPFNDDFSFFATDSPGDLGAIMASTKINSNGLQISHVDCSPAPVGCPATFSPFPGSPFATAANPVQVSLTSSGLPSNVEFVLVGEENNGARAPLEGFLLMLDDQMLTPMQGSPFTGIPSPDSLGLAVDVRTIAFGSKPLMILDINGTLHPFLLDPNTGAATALAGPEGSNFAFPVIWE